MRVIPRQVRRLKLPRLSTVLAILIAVSGTVVAGYLISQRVMSPSPPTAPRTATVTRGSIRATVNARGTVASLEPSHVNFPGSGTVDEVAVQVGDRVRAGQELARMDSAALRSALEQAEAKLDAERAKLQQMLSGPRPEDVTAANAELGGAQARLDRMQRARPEDVQSAEAAVEAANLKLQKLFQPEGADVAAAQSSLDSAMAQLAMDEARLQAAQSQVASDLASASAEVTSARSALQSAQQKLNLLLEPDPADVTAARSAVRNAQIALNTAEGKLAMLRNPRPEDVAAAQGEVESARATLAAAQAKLDQLLTPNPDDVTVARRAVEAAQANLIAAKERYEQLSGTGSNSSLVAAQSAFDSSAAAVRSAQAKLDQLSTPRDSDVKAAESSLEQAEAKLASILNPATDRDVEAQRQAVVQSQANLSLEQPPYLPSDIEVQVVAVKEAQASVDTAKFNLENATLTAPFDGIVTAVNMSPGETAVGAAAPITGGTTQSGITLVNPSRIRADVQVDEADISQVSVGQRAIVTFDALPNRRFPGTVTAIAPSDTTTQGGVGYLVSIALGNAEDVLPGMSAIAEITTARRDNVLTVPNRAISGQGQNRVVQVVTPNGLERRTIQVGLANEQITEVTAGLEEGDVVQVPTAPVRTAVPSANVGSPDAPGGPSLVARF